ncbi:MAG TPA: SRPBCC family protein [Candidatus Acidoferrales bacterium]|nr:SRPBCC family protein [Candidatus Acidoferrales bacterium]
MSQSAESTFVYVTFIRTTPEKLWSALTDAAQMKEYWFGMHIKAEWKPGAEWQMLFPDGRVADNGEIIEIERPKRIRLKWRNEFRPELKAEGFALCTMELEPVGASVRLTITHTIERADSKLIQAVSGGWPKILSNLKSMLETGQIVLTQADHSHAR